MSKMKPYRNFKVSIDYRLKASIDFYRPQETKASIDFQWQSKTWHFLRSSERLNRGAIWRWLCLPRSSDIEGYSAPATASTLSVTFLGPRKTQRSPL